MTSFDFLKSLLKIVDFPVPLAPNRKKLFDYLRRSVLLKIDIYPDLRVNKGMMSLLSRGQLLQPFHFLGHIFENLVFIECLKAQLNRGKVADLYFFRDSNGNEVDILYQDGRDLVAIEIKSSSTISSSQFKGLKVFQDLSSDVKKSYLIYNGIEQSRSNGINVMNYKNVDKIFK